MTKRKNIVLTNKQEENTRPLLVMVFFALLFVLISQVAIRLDNYNINSIHNTAGMKTIYHDENKEDINVLLDNGWYFIPDITPEEYEAHRYTYMELIEMPHAEEVNIVAEYGWNDLGNEAFWVNTDSQPTYITTPASAAYSTRIQLIPNTDTIYLHLDEVNGYGAVYCNGNYIGSVGSNIPLDFDITHSSETYPVKSNLAGFIDITIVIQSDSRIINPGLTYIPTLTSINNENAILVANSIWFAYQVIILLTCLVGGSILARTFINKGKFIITILMELLYIIYLAIDNNFIQLKLLQKAIICQCLMVAMIVLSFFFISYLFDNKELKEKHKFLRYDYILVSVVGILLLALEFIFRVNNSALYPKLSIYLLMSFTVVISAFKTIFFHLKEKASEIALTFITAMMFLIIFMINRKTTIYGIKIYTIFFFVLFIVLLITYSRSYVSQYNELSTMSNRLQYLLKEKTQHISEINKDLYNTNKRLMENEEARKNVLSNVSHDLRTPITAIRGYAELLISSGHNMKPEQVHNYLGNIIKRSTQMERIVSDIVELTRMESNAGEFQFTDISIAELLDELYMMYEGDVRGTTKKLQIQLPETDLLMAKADPKKISRVFENLISNAINYTYEEALIKINAWREGEDLPITEQTIHITISDNGIGIPQEEVDKVFDRFYRAKNSGKNIKGTGLGLSIVKTIIDHHNASISVKSALGSGTEFHIVMKATY